MKHDERLVEAVARAICLEEGGDEETWDFWTDTARAALDAINGSGIAWVAPWEAPVKEGEWESTFNSDTYASDELWEDWRDTYLAEQGERK